MLRSFLFAVYTVSSSTAFAPTHQKSLSPQPSLFAATLPPPTAFVSPETQDKDYSEFLLSAVAAPQQSSCIGSSNHTDSKLWFLLDLCKEKSLRSAQQAHELLLDLHHEETVDNDRLNLKTDHYLAVIRALGSCGQTAKAMEVLLLQESNPRVERPSRMTYLALMKPHIRRGNGNELNSILRRMEDDTTAVQPLTADYNAVLVIYARKGRVQKAEALLKRMMDRFKTQKVGTCVCQPNLSSYNLLLDALAKSCIDDSHGVNDEVGPHAEAILERMLKVFGTEYIQDVVYNKVIKVWMSSNSKQAGVRVEAMLKRMVDSQLASYVSYTSYIAILAKNGTPESAQRAYDIANEMLESYRRGDEKVKPSTITWNTVMSAFVNACETERAEEVLTRMEEFAEDEKTGMAPNIVSYSTVMDGWSKSNRKDSVERVEQAFERAVDAYEGGNGSARPSFWTYVTLIHCYCKHRTIESCRKAQDLIYAMYSESDKAFMLKPNVQLVTAVMDSWQKSGARDGAGNAQALLEWMLKAYEKDKDDRLAPNEYTFSVATSAAISAWGKSRSLGKALKARRILDQMIDLYESDQLHARPNIVCFTAVINACAYSEQDDIEKREALRVAVCTYKDLLASEYGNPNQVTYANFLTVLHNLLPASAKQSAAAQDVFQQAVKSGYVDSTVLRRVQSLVSPKDFQALLPIPITKRGCVRIDDLPRKWSRNIVQSSYH